MYYRIPLRFQKEIVLHILKNTLEHLLLDGTPSILGVFGPPGEGKTVMCKQILEDLGVYIKTMSVGEFESEDAGKPAENLRKKYNDAEEFLLRSPDNMSALIIDDADVAFGSWGEEVQYTVNTQIIIGELMQIANNTKIRKVPIILTGNDFSKIYYPLRRSGRMTSFFWEPTKEERLDSVKMIFDWLTEDDCKELIKTVEDISISCAITRPPVSFYSSVKGKLVDDELWNSVLQKRCLYDELSFIGEVSLPAYKEYSYDLIVELCKRELFLFDKANQNCSGGIINDEYKNSYRL